MEQIFCISLVFISCMACLWLEERLYGRTRVAWLPPVFTLQLVQNNGTTDTVRERERRTEVLTLRHTASVSLRLWLLLTPPPHTPLVVLIFAHMSQIRGRLRFFFVVVVFFFLQMCILSSITTHGCAVVQRLTGLKTGLKM